MNSIIGPRFGKILFEEGVVPDNCRVLSVRFEAGNVPVVTYELFLTNEKLEQFQKAFSKWLFSEVEKS